MKPKFFDKINDIKLKEKTVKIRESVGLTNTVWVVLENSDYKKLKKEMIK